jgi:cell wall-associated NlpC family hydrolase
MSDVLPVDQLTQDTLGPGTTDPLGSMQPLPGSTPPVGPTLSQAVNDPNAQPLNTVGGGIGATMVAAARHYLGVDYQWGGTSAKGVDCSGLVYLAGKAAGVDLPRISFEQANYGTRVALNKLRPGDLVAWDNSSRNPGADHIAIYIGNGQVIEAPHPGGKVQIVPIFDTAQAWGVRMPW